MALAIGGKKIGRLAIGGKAVSRLVYARRVIYSAVRACIAGGWWQHGHGWQHGTGWGERRR